MSQRLGRIVANRYRLDRLIAEGSMGEVYEATHLGIGRRVALKRMSPRFAASEEAIARFRREARAAGALDSEYIVQVFDCGWDATLGAFAVTELLVGEDLEVRLAREGLIDPLVAATIGYQVARGLAKAHAAGVVHRDLKPGNIFLAERDDEIVVAKILDFGISKSTLGADPDVDANDDSCLTAAGVTLGTPSYMSPEQARGFPDVDGRSDIWSLAVTLFEALAGGLPFCDDSAPTAVLTRIVYSDAPVLAEVAPWVPKELCCVVQAGLVRDRDARIADAATFARMLAEAMPCAAVLRSGAHSVAVIDGAARRTVPAPPPVCEPDGDAGVASDDAGARVAKGPAKDDVECPPSVDDRVELFRWRDGALFAVARK
jgi:serine/threonine-protein kinase